MWIAEGINPAFGWVTFLWTKSIVTLGEGYEVSRQIIRENLVLFPFEAVVLIQLCFWSFRNEMVMNWWRGIWLGLYQCRSECFGRSCLGMCNILPWSWIWFPQGANEDINFNMCTDTKCISSSFKASKSEKLKDKKNTFFLIYVMNILTIEKILLSYGQAERKMLFCSLMKV